MIVKLIYAIFLIWWWAAIIKYRRTVKSWTGNFVWAEHYLWRGWTYFIILLIWLCMIFMWVLYPFGWMDVFMNK